MIHFEKAIHLNNVFSKAFCDNSGALSAQACVLLEQVEYNKTQVTTMEPGKAIFRYWHVHTTADSGGQPGLVYLIDQSEFKAQLNLLKDAGVNSVTIRLNRGNLSLIADAMVTESGTKERGRRNIRQYSGPVEDFQPVFTPTNCVVEGIEAALFKSWVSSLQDFGQFPSAQTGDVVRRSVLINVKDNYLEGLANHANSYMAYIRSVLNCSPNEELQIAIEGRHLPRLGTISNTESVSIYIDEFEGESWVSFSGDSGCVSLKTVDPEQRFLVDYRLFGEDPRIKTESVRSVDLRDFTTATILQVPTDQAQQQLLILEEKPNFKIMQANNIKGDEFSLVQINPDTLEGEWQPCLIDFPGLKSIQKVIKAYQANLTDSNFILLTQKSVLRQSGTKSWICFIEPIFFNEKIQVSTFTQIIPVEEAINEVDVAE